MSARREASEGPTARPRRRVLLAGWRGYLRLRRNDEHRAADALKLGRRLVRRGRRPAAIEVYRTAEARIGQSHARLAVAVPRAKLELRAGIVPRDLNECVRELVGLADTMLATGDSDAAGARMQEAFDLAFHRTLHLEDLPSPLASDPDAFLAPFRSSGTYRRLVTSSGAVKPRRTPAGFRPRRILFTTFRDWSWSFVSDVVEDYRSTPGVEVRTLDLEQIPDEAWRSQPVDLVKRRLHQAAGVAARQPPAEVREAFDWADVIFVEWGQRALPWVSLQPDVEARIVARIHSYEAFTALPTVTDWSRIDDVVFVSPHIRKLVEASVPGVTRGPRLHTIPNRNELDRFVRPKSAQARHTLGMVGWNSITKDPLWTLDLLEVLLREDPRWRLRLLGDAFPRPRRLSGRAASYRKALRRRLKSLGDAVERPGFAPDLPEALRDIGVIVSSSRREGTHEGMLQAAASGSFPIVRNWPYVARWGGAATIVLADWVVSLPEEGARLLLDAVANEAAFQAACAERAAWIREHYDWSVVRPRLDAILLEDPSD